MLSEKIKKKRRATNMDKESPVKVGVIGTGNISSIYLKNSKWLKPLEIVAVADIDLAKATTQAAAFDIPKTCTVEEILAEPTIDLILNLTIPEAHGSVAMAALAAGKSVYNEKPLALNRDEAQSMLTYAKEHGLLVGCAPDTVMGAGLQTCRRLIDNGEIGKPVAATAFMMCPGHESWHPSPAFYYQPGGGPMFDMGPYYLTALVNLLGPVTAVSGLVTTGQSQRIITSQPLAGQTIDVKIPTHVAGLMNFANGAVATIVTSFDVPGHKHPCLEIYGTEATISVPDPNTFGGPVWLKRQGEDWQEIPLSHSYSDNSRGLGLADMAAALRDKKNNHRANGEIAYHVLDLMWAFHDAAEQGQQITLQSQCQRPEPMPTGSVFSISSQ
jgi:predicted dehydrogenase